MVLFPTLIVVYMTAFLVHNRARGEVIQMRATLFEQFQGPVSVTTVPDPVPARDGVVVAVRATGLCRSDWHGWMGHDSDVVLPHVPGHELAGEIVALGPDVKRWRRGDRVTVPFSMGCGRCPQCSGGNQQICDDYFQPGFTGWGSFAEYVALPHADANLVRLLNDLSFEAAALLGCRFVTAFRGLVAQARVAAGEWVVVFGLGGVGLSAVMIAAAQGAQVIGVDIDDGKLAFARTVGLKAGINAAQSHDVPQAVAALTNGGAHVSVDALGSRQTVYQAVQSLRKRGRHVQIGLLLGDDVDPPMPLGAVVGRELEIYGSHGMQAHAYPPLLGLVADGRLQLSKLVGRRLTLDEVPAALKEMDTFAGTGVAVIDPYA